MKNTNVDKGWITLVFGPLTGLLVMSGHLEPSNATVVLDELNTLVGAVITIVTVIGALHHQIEMKKLEQPKTDTTIVTTPPTTVQVSQ